MGHRHDAVEALRAYAQSLEEAIDDGSVHRVGSAYQDDARPVTSDLGAPQLRVLVGLVGVVLVGLVGTGVVAATLAPQSDDASPSTADTLAASQVVLPEPATNSAIRALARIGSTDGLAAVTYAMATDSDRDPAVSAIIAIIADLSSRLANGAADFGASIELEQAIDELIAIIRPPGLDPDWTPPGLGGVAPGQDDTFVPPGQDDTFVPPGQDDTTPPGQGDTTPPGQEDKTIPPGQEDKSKPPGQDNDPDPGTANGRDR
ncbi:MAG TPA: hypothetical protein VLA29_06285 [Acidimicrobiia bacterium]|nr:hypothetical protein [Acidimicrobiia bacterium]